MMKEVSPSRFEKGVLDISGLKCHRSQKIFFDEIEIGLTKEEKLIRTNLFA
jgi:hypothetical protein